MTRASFAQIGDLPCYIIQRQAQPAHSRQQRRADAGQFDAFRCALEQPGIHRELQPTQALAQRGLTQAQRGCGALHLPVFGDRSEIFHVT
jgi:hypothetical protein